MNGIDKIIAHLEAEAQAEIDAQNAETKGRCDEILAAAKAEADAAFAARLKAGTAEAALQAERLASAAELEEKKALLAYKQTIVKQTFDAAEAQIAALPQPAYAAFLARLAAGAANSGDEELILNAADAAAIGPQVVREANRMLQAAGKRGGLTLCAETRAMSGGVVLRCGNIESNCSIAALLEAQRSALASPVAEILFSE